MQLFENGLNLFGVEIISKKKEDNLTAALSTEENDDGAAIVAAAGNGGPRRSRPHQSSHRPRVARTARAARR